MIINLKSILINYNNKISYNLFIIIKKMDKEKNLFKDLKMKLIKEKLKEYFSLNIILNLISIFNSY